MPFDQEQYHQRRDVLIAMLGGKCSLCGSQDELEFDHLDPDTKIACVTELLSNYKKAMEEAKKCRILCNACHTKHQRTKERPPHGTVRRYNYSKEKCRCTKCKSAWNSYMKEYRLKPG